VIYNIPAWDNDRTFNGVLPIVRIYDRPLTEGELNRNITGHLAVNPMKKLTTAGAKMKTGH